jgi:hypothetical protein
LISTVGGNDYEEAVPPRPDTPEAPGEFEFESDDEDPIRAEHPGLTEEERYFFEYINSEVIRNPQTWPLLNRQYNNGYITGTRFRPHDFYLSHFLEHEWNIAVDQRAPLPYAVSETDLIRPEHRPFPHETREHEYEPSNSSSSSLAGPDDPNLYESPSNSSYFTAVVIQPTLSSTEVNSGENTQEDSSSRSASPSQEEQ